MALTSAGRILLVEDEDDLALALKARLESAGRGPHRAQRQRGAELRRRTPVRAEAYLTKRVTLTGSWSI